MAILKAKVVFTKIWDYTPGQERKTTYLVSADVQVSTQKTHLHVDIVDGFVEKKVPTKHLCANISFWFFSETSICSSTRKGKRPQRNLTTRWAK